MQQLNLDIVNFTVIHGVRKVNSNKQIRVEDYENKSEFTIFFFLNERNLLGRLHAAWFHLYGIPEKKEIEKEQICGYQELRVEKDVTPEG